MAPIHRLAQLTNALRAPAAGLSQFTPTAATATATQLTVRTPAALLARNLTSAASSSPPPLKPITNKDRAFYPYSIDIQSRWADNDQYGHMNNAHYYALFDTIINTFLIQETGLDPHDQNQGNAIGVVAESGCQYYNSVSFPDMIEARLAVIKLGRSSVVYQVGIFKKLATPSDDATTASTGANRITRSTTSPSAVGVFSRAATAVLGPVLTAEEIKKEFPVSQLLGDVAATGHFCHVFVDKVSRRPVPIPAKIRAGLELLQVVP
ncbi:MAG: HotDog domain-containing protein [Linnemannia gamsii]|nr:MAG: HotDog domain-containing protein [Linnemannia gamsii]